MLPVAISIRRALFRSHAGLPVRMNSSGTHQKGILANRVAVVTGSTDGIGFAIARRLARDGAHVVVSSRKQQNVDRAVAALQGEGLSVTGTVCHVGKAEDREKLVTTALEHSGGVDFLVCNAAVNPLVGSTLGTSEQVWDKVLSVNVKAPALLLSHILPHMEKRGGGPLIGIAHRPCCLFTKTTLPSSPHLALLIVPAMERQRKTIILSKDIGGGAVILVSSVTAYTPLVELGTYNVSKTALLGLTRTLAVELAPKGIRVNCLVPGLIKTDFSNVLHKNEATWNNLKEKHQLQRMGQPEDCAGLVSFLCSPDASYITGESIVVAGFSPRL